MSQPTTIQPVNDFLRRIHLGAEVFYVGQLCDAWLPTVVITGRGGKIVWTHETDNYRIRPEPDVYLGVLRQHGIIAV